MVNTPHTKYHQALFALPHRGSISSSQVSKVCRLSANQVVLPHNLAIHPRLPHLVVSSWQSWNFQGSHPQWCNVFVSPARSWVCWPLAGRMTPNSLDYRRLFFGVSYRLNCRSRRNAGQPLQSTMTSLLNQNKRNHSQTWLKGKTDEESKSKLSRGKSMRSKFKDQRCDSVQCQISSPHLKASCVPAKRQSFPGLWSFPKNNPAVMKCVFWKTPYCRFQALGSRPC